MVEKTLAQKLGIKLGRLKRDSELVKWKGHKKSGRRVCLPDGLYRASARSSVMPTF